MDIGGQSINGYCSYYINGYWWLIYSWLFMVIILMVIIVILLMDIGG